MNDTKYEDAVREICAKDPRFDPWAYFFLREALDFTVRLLKKPSRGPGRHVTGQELLGGLRKYAIREFGPMAHTVLNTWGITRTEDFGEVVFNLVSAGELGKTQQDSRRDFANGYDFYDAFVKPFVPGTTPKRRKPAGREKSRSRAPASGAGLPAGCSKGSTSTSASASGLKGNAGPASPSDEDPDPDAARKPGASRDRHEDI